MNMSSFPSHLTRDEVLSLNIGDKIDHRDCLGRYYPATIVGKKENTNLKIHYQGYAEKYDTWCDYQKHPARFVKVNSISKRPPHRFKDIKKGDYVDVNPKYRDRSGWKKVKIIEIVIGQIKVNKIHILFISTYPSNRILINHRYHT